MSESKQTVGSNDSRNGSIHSKSGSPTPDGRTSINLYISDEKLNEQRRKSLAIDEMLRQDAEKLDPEKHLQILMLGPGDSGKTTILKQMKLLHGDGFTDAEREQAKLSIYQSILRTSRILVTSLIRSGRSFGERTNKLVEALLSMMSKTNDRQIDTELCEMVAKLCTEPLVVAFMDSKDLPFEENGRYFMTHILMCRRKTEQISETIFKVEDRFWHMIDVAGQLDKRSKWMHYFDRNVSCLMYIFSAIGYCQVLEEDKDVNRLTDALDLFGRLSSRRQDQKVPSRNDKKEYLHWVTQFVREKAEKAKLQHYVYNTTALDTKLMKKGPSLASKPEGALGTLSQDLQYIPPELPNVQIYKSDEKLFAARRKSIIIDKQLKQEAKKMDPENNYHLLMLGPGDAGKTTFLKQMKLLHGDGFTDAERSNAVKDIHSVIARNVSQMLPRLEKLQLEYLISDQCRSFLEAFKEGDMIDPEIAKSIKDLFVNPMFQDILKESKELSVDDMALWFLQKADVVASKDYKATDEDYIGESVFQVHGRYWHIYDVAGQIDKRSRWATFFDRNLNAVIYIFSAASYCQKMEEDPSMNRLQDALSLIDQVLQNDLLHIPALIVFVNKIDLLDDRLKHFTLRDWIPSYTGPCIDSRQEQQGKVNKKMPLYLHKTTATDTNTMKKRKRD
ncbi:guanine nucleotide binding protein, alpha subunit [Gorgonomyces haynaldii]|nr:guanine nucleotide binding protein, alpha subunit [Gorgonomyces haynaldii]